MKKAPIPSNEEERLLSLHTLGLLDTEPEERFDRITRAATKIFHAPISTLTLVDAKREWFKSCQGLPEKEGDRAVSFCGHALLADDVFVIEDTAKDERFSDNPMVVGPPYIRFYAGVPIMSADGERVGVFCVKDRKPRTFSKEEKEILKSLALWAELEINSRNLHLASEEEKKLREKLLKQYKAAEELRVRNEAVLQSVGDGLIVVDRKGRITEMSNAAGELLGIMPAEYIGRQYEEVWKVKDRNGGDVSQKDRPMRITLRTGEKVSTGTSSSYYYERKDGTAFPAAITVTPVVLNGEIIGAVDVFRDISKDKEIDQAKSEFISLASHQLKTPPTAIKLLTELLLDGKIGALGQKQKEYIGDIRSSNQRMIDLVSALLNVSRIELGTFSIQVEVKNAVGVVKSAVAELKPIIGAKGIRLETDFPDNEVRISIDEPLFRMVINNFVTNAVNYTAPGGMIGVSCSVKMMGETIGGKLLQADCFVVAVSDTGYGIPVSQQDRIFTKLFRADNAREKYVDGTGLGLYIVKSILDRSGGSAWFKSRENEGSVFYAAVPVEGMRTKTSDEKFAGG